MKELTSKPPRTNIPVMLEFLNDIVCLDVDTKQDDPSIGLKTFEIINKYIKDNKIKCRIMKTNNGWHFYFKNPNPRKI